ncbi:MAG: PAS domain-containing protein [Gammaproteobacteria bacterium]|nr:PAS domain-containing protein [Gammaproteobacteria bacterium]MBU1777099.1 PAS domain-containing protein [Gammaproteobacteria bacterium]MBU1968427.1 PAS domain-containing protein [Gammaproteobacteria bacterium]
MIAKNLRILLVETSDADAQRTLSKLTQAGYRLQHRLVDNARDMKTALSNDTFDIVLCSYDPPGFGGLPALELMQESGVDIPFLFLSHDLREETIIHTMQRGADDYIFKGSLNRLSSSIEHNLREARIRREHRAAQLALQENQLRLQAFIADLPGMAYQMLQHADGHVTFPYVSEGSQALLGTGAQDLTHVSSLFEALLHPDDLASYRKSMQASAKNLTFWNWEGRILTQPDNEIKWINIRCSPRRTEQGILWEGIVFNITQSKLAEFEIRNSKAQLRELSSHIQEVREQERISIAREIHDDMGSTLTAIKLDIAWLAGRLADHPALADKARSIEVLVDKCSAAARNISHSLRPSALDTFGIAAAIESEADEFERRTGISCVFGYDTEIDDVPPDISIALFRIFQETLANIIKHAHASEVEVSMRDGEDGIELTVRDNGCGITATDRVKPRSFGLRGIRERVEYFGGRVSIESQPGQGTRVSVLVPRDKTRPVMDELLAQQKLF